MQELFGETRKLPKDRAGINIKGLTADSRQVEPGFLFAALPGVAADGVRFVSDALKNGAVAILTGDAQGSIDTGNAVLVRVSNPRRELALAAARFYQDQPEILAAVTGTNGKTSVASFLRQIWVDMGFCAANLGTTGVFGPEGHTYLGLTTPGPVQLHKVLRDLVSQGVTHGALEASSHGLEQNRLDGVRITAAAFTNISRDHLDYHDGFEDYFAQKQRLFEELLPENSAVVTDRDSTGSDVVCQIAERRNLRLFCVGRKGGDLRLVGNERDGFGQRLAVEHEGRVHDVYLPLAGDFQVSNALVAAGLAIVCGADAGPALAALEKLQGASGRLELVGKTGADAPVFVDYAHTPDALANALEALRPYVSRNLVVVFGAGGDRDKGKRPLMGEVAARLADKVIVTDDNPRGEDPAAIRAEILESCPGADEIGARAGAIETAIAGLGEGDVLLVAGKGHEEGQIVGDEVLPFSDHRVVSAALAKGAGT